MNQAVPVIVLAGASAENRLCLREMLSELDALIVETDEGGGLDTLAREHEPALLIVDTDLSGVDGPKILNHFLADQQLCRMPVLVLLNTHQELHEMAGAGSGNIIDYLRKPVASRFLLRKVRAALDMARYRGTVEALALDEERILDAGQGLLGVDAGGAICYADPLARQALGAPLETMPHTYIESVFERKQAKVSSDWKRHVIYTTCAKGKRLHVKTTNLCRLDGTLVPVTYVAAPAPEDSDLFAVLAFQVVGARVQDSAPHADVSRTDPLTGLPGRKRLELAVGNSISRAEAQGDTFAVLYLDLDHFKYVNDTLGHDIGDLLLQKVAERLSELVDAEDLLTHLGSDEFALLLVDLPDTKLAAITASRLINAIETRFLIEGHEIFTGCSVGIATYPHCGDRPRLLIRNAATALHRAKAAGRHQFEFYTAEMNRQNIERMRIETALHHALGRSEFEVRYLPLYETRSGNIVGFEGLIRWPGPDGEPGLPDTFMDVAEECGLMPEITRWVVERICTDCADLRGRYPAVQDMYFAINMPTSQLLQPGFLHDLRTVLSDTDVPASVLLLDLTERALVRSLPECMHVLQGLIDEGVRLVLDDLGAGYSSLKFLRDIDLFAIKIDRSLIEEIEGRERNLHIVRSIIAMSHSLGLNAIAEGVETEGQFELLRRKRCDWVQGFLFTEPLDMAEVKALLDTYTVGPG